MPNLFGVNIQAEIASAFKGQLVPAVLTKISKGSRGTNPTGGFAISETDYDCEGFIEDNEQVRFGGTLISQGGRYISLLGGSILGGAVYPETGDKITIEGKTYEITEIAERDPAAALYKCRVEV